MKKLIFIHILAGILYVSGVIWTIFEIIFYIIDKDPINWGSVQLLVGGLLLGFANMIYAIMSNKIK